MEDLISALNIFLKYGNSEWPTWCRHDELHVNISPDVVSESDINILEELGFRIDDENDDFVSFKFGSC